MKKHKPITKSSKKKQADKKINIFENNQLIYILLAIAVLFVFFIRIRLLSFPFERDEGEYAYMGKLILDGHVPYTFAYNMKLPGTYFMYALFMMFFGKSIVGVHLGVAIMTSVSMCLLFLIAKRFVSGIGAVIASASFGILGISYFLLAQAAHATHFVVFFALSGIFLTFKIYDSEKNKILKYFFSGVLFSLAFISKQSGIFFVFFGALIIIFKEFDVKHILKLIRNLSIYSAGFISTLLLMLVCFYFFGDFDKFWFWTVKYLSAYGEQVPMSQVPETFKIGISSITSGYSISGYIALWFMALIGILFIFINKVSKQNKFLTFSFILLSFLTVVPGFYFRNHYFISLLPAFGLLVAIFFEFFNNIFINKFKIPNLIIISFFVFIFIAGKGVSANKDYLFKKDTKILCKQIYGSNPFVESIAIADFLKKNTKQDDKIAVLGSEPQICFYADRYSATGYIYTYSLVEIHSYALAMQKEMIKEIERNKPKYFLFINVGMSWLSRPNSEQLIFKWSNEYITKYYKIVGLVDILPNAISPLISGVQLNSYVPQSKELVYIFEKNK